MINKNNQTNNEKVESNGKKIGVRIGFGVLAFFLALLTILVINL